MFFRLLGCAGILLFSLNVWARASTLEGIVRDPAGHPIKGADIRIEAKSGSNFSKTVKTDATGHYISDRLPAGDYKVSLIVDGSVKASILNARTQSDKATRLNFELTPKTGSTKRHMVWVPAETGTHIGNGRWVEVDEKGNIPDHGGTSSVIRTGAADIGKIANRPRSPTGN